MSYTTSKKVIHNKYTHRVFDLSIKKIEDLSKEYSDYWLGCPDQIQFIGSNHVKKFIFKMNTTYRKSMYLPASLHDLLYFFSIHFDHKDISYLNYIENPRPDSDKCFVTGNPAPPPPDKKHHPGWWGNNLYNYTRYIK